MSAEEFNKSAVEEDMKFTAEDLKKLSEVNEALKRLNDKDAEMQKTAQLLALWRSVFIILNELPKESKDKIVAAHAGSKMKDMNVYKVLREVLDAKDSLKHE